MEKNIVYAPNILLPKQGSDLNKYAVIACDQFTSQIDYWNDLKKMIGSSLSTFHMVYPEAYLENTNQEEYIANINKNMNRYLNNGDLVDLGRSFILVERTTGYGMKRLGIVLAIDLEEYSFERGSKATIKASEATIIERIPPRLKIRKDAPIELPHTLLLFEDKDKTIVEKYYAMRDTLPVVYDFDLNKDGGHIKGYLIKDCDEIIKLFNNLYLKNNNGLLFVVGDGNHSLATAKVHWENLKKTLSEEERNIHPARFALVEANNVYDDGINFEPIHRILFNVNDDFVAGLKEVCHGDKISYIYQKNVGRTPLNTPNNNADTYAVIQNYIDLYLKNHSDSKVDFIHDESSLIEVADANPGSVAIVMPALGKSDIFDFVSKDQVLPRKSFSLGHASEKRYYLEAKKIVK